MAFPTGWSTSNYVSVAGITLGLFPSDQGFDVELQRSTAVAAPTSKWVVAHTFGLGTNTEIVYQDVLPLTTKLAFYRARHVKVGYTPGAYSTVVSARPQPLRLNSKVGFGSTAMRHLRTISTADNTLTTSVGAGAAGITKTVTISAATFVPENSATSFFVVNELQQSDANGSDRYFVATLTLPPGVTITGVEFRGFRTAVTDVVSMSINRITEATGAATQLALLTHVGTGQQTIASGALSEVVGTGPYLFEVRLQHTTNPVDARFMLARVTYTMPSYRRSL